MNIQKLYEDFSIPYAPEGHRHYRDGWINTNCPFCSGHEGMHLGWEIESNHYYCWRCGFHKTTTTISKLLRITEQEVKHIIRQYRVGITTTKETKAKIRRKAFRLPSNTEPLSVRHKQYLERRGFDPDYLETQYGLLGTGPVSTLDKINYKFRIIAPIYWIHGDDQVSFQGRDITNRSKLKYITCPKDRELIFHKDILYMNTFPNDLSLPPFDIGICVEGITDVWRFGDYSFATFGIEYTHKQVRLISQMFKRVAVVFDDEPQAVIQANKLVGELKFRGVDAWRVDIDGDPGGMKQVDADYLVKNIIR